MTCNFYLTNISTPNPLDMIRCLNDYPLSLAQWGLEPQRTKDIHPLADCSGGVVAEDEGGFHSLLPQAYKHTANLWFGPALWLCFGPSLPLPDHRPSKMLQLRHTQHIHFYSTDSPDLFGLCLGKTICYPFRVTQLLHKCSHPDLPNLCRVPLPQLHLYCAPS